MNILHINNYANVSTELRNAQIALGHNSRIVQLNKSALLFNFSGEDYRINDESPYLLERTAYRLYLLKLINEADIIHVHGGFWHKYLTYYIKLKKKKFILHYHGSDVRNQTIGNGPRRNEKYANKIILSTPDLRTSCPKGIYIPNPVTPYQKRNMKDSKIRIIHAHSNHPNLEQIKGSYTIKSSIKNIYTEIHRGQPSIEFREISGINHQEALQKYSECDIAIDQLRIGWYGTFALECMAMGIPTLGYKTHYYENNEEIYNPIIGVTDFDLKKVTEEFVFNWTLRDSIGKSQKLYVEQNHNPLKIAQRIDEEIYGVRK